MKRFTIYRSGLTSSVLLISLLFSTNSLSQSGPQKGPDATLEAFSGIRPIDVHVHVFKNDPEFQFLLDRLHLTLLNILVVDDTLAYRKQLQPQITQALALMHASHDHVAFCTTFDPYKFYNPDFTSQAITQINRDFSDGAIAVKIWKNVGMEIRDHNGKFIMPDDPKFGAMYKDIAQHGKTLIAHLAEPDVAWGPPDPSDPSWSYYQENPQWFLYNKPGVPSKQRILTARDYILEQNPNLRMVGAHLGSMEKNLEEIAAHFDRYPNFAVDTAARMEYLMIAPREKVRAFLIKYQDRVLYGTDLDLIATDNVHESLKDWESTYARDWKFLSGKGPVYYRGKNIPGLNLPRPVLQKLFHDNALHWLPGIGANSKDPK